MSAMTSKLVDVVRQLATRRVDKFFHSASNTHIFFQPYVGPLGVKGVADFSDEAFGSYVRALNEVLSALSNEELAAARDALLAKQPGVEQRREIQLEVPVEVKDWLVSRAEADNIRLTEVVQMIVMESLPQDFQKSEVRFWYHDLSNKLEVGLGNVRSKSRRSISVRWAPDKLGRIRQVASTLGERDSNLIKKVVLADYVAHGQKSTVRAQAS